MLFFRSIIVYYVDKYSPMDKAGAYGVQEWIGFIGVESISGSYYNVMGLPVQKLYRELINSPRRKELMSGLGVDYVVKTLPDVDESYPDTLQGEEIPAYISREKAEAYQSMIEPDELLITADTIVWMNGEVLGKPKDREDAIRMLRKLSGASHQVITGVCLTTKGWQNSFTVTTDVTFAVLSEEEINSARCPDGTCIAFKSGVSLPLSGARK